MRRSHNAAVDGLRQLSLDDMQELHSNLILALVQQHGVAAAMTLIGSTLQWLASAPQGQTALVQHAPTTSIIIRRWHTATAHAALLPDPWEALRIDALAADLAVRRRWDLSKGAWSADVIIVKVERDAFAHGAMRSCHRMKLHVGSHLGWRSSSCNFVAKRYSDPVESVALLEADCRMQMVAKSWAAKFNAQRVPKPVDFIECWMCHVPQRANLVSESLQSLAPL